MLEFQPSTWDWWMWTLHAIGALYVLGFITYFVRFEVLERKARRGGAAKQRYARALQGFPAAFYAKMLGRSPPK